MAPWPGFRRARSSVSRYAVHCRTATDHRPLVSSQSEFFFLSTHEELRERRRAKRDGAQGQHPIRGHETPFSRLVAICSGMPTALLLSPLAAARRLRDTRAVVPLGPHASVPHRPEASVPLPVRRRLERHLHLPKSSQRHASRTRRSGVYASCVRPWTPLVFLSENRSLHFPSPPPLDYLP